MVDQSGYLIDPESSRYQYYSNKVLDFETINQQPCLVLLGEPGQGKTHALEDAQNTPLPDGAKSLEINLKGKSNEDRIEREIFEHANFKSWLEGNHLLYIFIDSLDECAIRLSNLSRFLALELQKRFSDSDKTKNDNKKAQLARLRLRLACRTADWQTGFQTLQTTLKSLWSEDAVGLYELVSLRKKDIIIALESESLNAEKFLERVEILRAAPLAVKPITLNLLIRLFRKNPNDLAKTQIEVYEQGCLELAKELDNDRTFNNNIRKTTPEQRLEIASRMAAMTIFGRKRFISLNDTIESYVPSEVIQLSEFAGKKENAQGNDFVVTAIEIRETIYTSLFSAGGENELVWAHQTYAEFLAARYLKQKGLSLEKLLDFIVHPNDLEKKIVPQLRETASWLASLDAQVFQDLIRRDPQVLLRSDVAVMDNESRKLLVAGLLQAYEAELLLPRADRSKERYSQLNHPELSIQLLPFLEDEKAKWGTREFAIDLVEMNQLNDLEHTILQIALNPHENIQLRGRAALALEKVGSNDTKTKLKPLTMGEAGDDPDDELKGIALRVLWSGFLSLEDLLLCLTQRKKYNFFGRYHVFLSQDFLKSINTKQQLQQVLIWLTEKQNWTWICESIVKYGAYSGDSQFDQFLARALDNLDDNKILKALAKFLFERCINDGRHDFKFSNESPFIKKLILQPEVRHAILSEIINHHNVNDNRLWSLVRPYNNLTLIVTQDLTWVLEQLESAPKKSIQQRWAAFIPQICNRADIEQLQAVHNVYLRNLTLQKELIAWFGPIKLRSKLAKKMKEDHKEHLKNEEEMKQWNQEKPVLNPPPEVRVQNWIEKTKEDYKNWWILSRELMLEPDDTHYHRIFEVDVQQFYGWKKASNEQQAEILSGAFQYLLFGEPVSERWLGKNTSLYSALAGYQALFLISKMQFDLSPLSKSIWEKWACIIVDQADLNTLDDKHATSRILLEIAFKNAPDEVIRVALILAEKDAQAFNSIFVLHRLKYIWDDRMSEAFYLFLKDKMQPKHKLKPDVFGSLLDVLLEKNYQPAHELALAYLNKRFGKIQKEFALRSAIALACHATNKNWNVIWSIVQTDRSFGKNLLLAIANKPIEKQLLVRNVIALYCHLVEVFPHTEDPKHDSSDGTDEVTPRDDIANWQRSLIANLRERGTEESVSGLEQIFVRYPDQDWLKWEISNAREKLRSQTWKPLEPNTILELTQHPKERFISSTDQLLEVVLQSLERFQQRLKGETSMSSFLWNEWKFDVNKQEPDNADRQQRTRVRKKTRVNEESPIRFRPKDENSFSDFIKLFLEADLKGTGVIFNREVEIRRRQGNSPGERTDISVDVSLERSKDRVGIIIEVKGCWNKDLETAMQDQLVNRYLHENPKRYGIYLVGWFLCDQWDKDHDQFKATKKLGWDVTQARSYFVQQAMSFSKENQKVVSLVLDTGLR